MAISIPAAFAGVPLGDFFRGTDGCLFPDVAGTCSSFVEVGGKKMGGEENPSQDGKGHEMGTFFFGGRFPKKQQTCCKGIILKGLFPYSAVLRLGNSMTPARCKDVKLAGAYRQESIQ